MQKLKIQTRIQCSISSRFLTLEIKLKLELETRNSNSKLEAQSRNSNSKLEFEILEKFDNFWTEQAAWIGFSIIYRFDSFDCWNFRA